jgi:phage protein D/phage baseplate assembly protein gpV
VPAEAALMDHFYVKIDGIDLATEVMDDLIEISVDTSLHLPSMFTIHIHDEELTWLGQEIFDPGKAVEICAVPESGGPSQTLIKGEITALEPEFGEGTQATLLVRGYDRAHRLHRGTHSRTYLQMTDSDVAEKIAREAGLKARVDPTRQVYEYILQYNQTYTEFLGERAQRAGYEFFVDDDTLYFKEPPKNGRLLELEWGLELLSFSPRLTLVEQVDEVIVRGWDPKNRQVIIGQASRGQAEPKAGQKGSGAQLASTAFNNARRMVVNRGVSSQTEADAQAQALCDEISGAFIEADGIAYGQPDLRAGRFVKLTALGRRFSGTYFVTEASHIYRADASYMTIFSISGRRPDTLFALMERARPGAECPGGPVVGLVTNNKDPEGRGRVKVQFPWLSDEIESHWARLVGLGAGPERGFFCLPEVNDEVLVTFEHGDVNRPYVIGGVWNGQDKPPLPTDQALDASRGQVHRRIFKTRAGHSLTLTDGPDASLVLETAGGHRLTLADEKQQVVLETKNGLVLKMDDTKKEIVIEAPGNLNLKGHKMKLEATAEMTLNAARVNINDGALEVI